MIFLQGVTVARDEAVAHGMGVADGLVHMQSGLCRHLVDRCDQLRVPDLIHDGQRIRGQMRL